jgi:hypothetical protein
MHINFDKQVGVAIFFPVSELKFAVSVLKGINAVAKLSFIREAIEDIEASMRPRLTLVTHYHLCSCCYRELDDRDPDTLKIGRDDDITYKHRICPPLKPDSKRER